MWDAGIALRDVEVWTRIDAGRGVGQMTAPTAWISGARHMGDGEGEMASTEGLRWPYLKLFPMVMMTILTISDELRTRASIHRIGAISRCGLMRPAGQVPTYL